MLEGSPAGRRQAAGRVGGRAYPSTSAPRRCWRGAPRALGWPRRSGLEDEADLAADDRRRGPRRRVACTRCRRGRCWASRPIWTSTRASGRAEPGRPCSGSPPSRTCRGTGAARGRHRGRRPGPRAARRRGASTGSSSRCSAACTRALPTSCRCARRCRRWRPSSREGGSLVVRGRARRDLRPHRMPRPGRCSRRCAAGSGACRAARGVRAVRGAHRRRWRARSGARRPASRSSAAPCPSPPNCRGRRGDRGDPGRQGGAAAGRGRPPAAARGAGRDRDREHGDHRRSPIATVAPAARQRVAGRRPRRASRSRRRRSPRRSGRWRRTA